MIISRRLFVAWMGGAVAASFPGTGMSEDPTLLDHLLLGCNDLQHGIEFVQQRTGVRAVFGGVHPGRGTQNALLSLGTRRYLEIIAPDPAQSDTKNPLALELHSLTDPKLVGWAAHPGNLAAYAETLRAAGIPVHGPTPGSRQRPDGRLLKWQTLGLADDSSGLLPFFIEWATDSTHPSEDAPKGCTLVAFSAASPDPAKLKETLQTLHLDLPVTSGARPGLHATIAGPAGKLELTS